MTSPFDVGRLVLRERQSRDRGWYDRYPNRIGHDVRPDHLGDDRPPAAALHDEADTPWPHQNPTPAETAGKGEEQQ